MIDRHYGHLARDGREHAIKLLDALNAPEFEPWTLRGRRTGETPSARTTQRAVEQAKQRSPLTDSNRRPPPYHGGALPTELRGQVGRMVAEQGCVDFRGYRTWYRIVGDRSFPAAPLLALHGGPGSTHNYFAPLEGLADERPVVLYDQIGCGNSDRPQDIEWDVGVFREEVDVVRQQLGLERIHLLGTSWGGMLALEHFLSGAQGIVSLTLSSTLASIDEWVVEQKRLVADLPLEVREVLDRHEQAGTYGDPEYESAMEGYFD